MTAYTAPAPEHPCGKCYRPSSSANLTTLPTGEKWCPRCVHENAMKQIARDPDAWRPPAPAPVRLRADADHGLRVEDVPRGMAARRAALERRRSA